MGEMIAGSQIIVVRFLPHRFRRLVLIKECAINSQILSMGRHRTPTFPTNLVFNNLIKFNKSRNPLSPLSFD